MAETDDGIALYSPAHTPEMWRKIEEFIDRQYMNALGFQWKIDK